MKNSVIPPITTFKEDGEFYIVSARVSRELIQDLKVILGLDVRTELASILVEDICNVLEKENIL